MKLNCETNTERMGKRIARAFQGLHQHRTETVFEHDQWWVNCPICGGQWSAVDAEGPNTFDGFGFEQVSEGED